MCQISVCNLGDELLNKKLFLLMGSSGSTIHNDGWGYGTGSGELWKCSMAMYGTSDAGVALLQKSSGKTPLLGHIRQASKKVPVNTKNAHPFSKKNIVFVHNGTLTPKDEKNFVMTEEVNEIDPKTSKVVKDENGAPKKISVSRSDSLIFFEEFLKHYKDEEHFVEALNETMNLFTGKFAFVFIINGNYYIVRGKTADLHIVYLYESYDKDAKVVGWAINTSKQILDESSNLLSNLVQLDGKKPLPFSYPVILEEESVFIARNDGLEKIGEIKENKPAYSAAATAPARQNRGAGDSNFYGSPTGTGTVITTEIKERVALYKEIYEFMKNNSISIGEIQALFSKLYGASLLEVTKAMLMHFTKKAIPALNSKNGKEGKQLRKRLRKALSGSPVRTFQYSKDMEYPWMLNLITVQREFVSKIEGSRK